MAHTDAPLATTSTGHVYLIGAGPGDPRLITLRGLECLRMADVVIYDYLASPELLQETKPGATLIYAGKRGGNHTLRQPEINQLLVRYARAGHIVARLKGGDPFVFGRGGEEAEILAQAGISWEVVPGVSAAVAVPAYAGIPVTHRDYAASFVVVTGHEEPTKEQSHVNWQKLATGADTLILLMGVANMEAIVHQLLHHGRPPTTPVAVVHWGTVRRQRTLTGTLANITERVRAAGIKPPATMIVGEVVTLRERLRWFDTHPLTGYRVLLIGQRSAALASIYTALHRSGADVVILPRHIPAQECQISTAQLPTILSSCAWVILAGSTAVTELRHLLWQVAKDWRALGNTRIAATDEETKQTLATWGLRADAILETFPANRQCTIELPTETAPVLIVDPMNTAITLLNQLQASGCQVKVWCGAIGRAIQPEITERRLLVEDRPDVLVVTAPEEVETLLHACAAVGIQSISQHFASALVIACDDLTARACHAAGLAPVLISAPALSNAFSAELAAHLATT
jgi:uroporphyrinogen III methyltransferase/synthase